MEGGEREKGGDYQLQGNTEHAQNKTFYFGVLFLCCENELTRREREGGKQ